MNNEFLQTEEAIVRYAEDGIRPGNTRKRIRSWAYI